MNITTRKRGPGFKRVLEEYIEVSREKREKENDVVSLATVSYFYF